jgi:hypothetical protein
METLSHPRDSNLSVFAPLVAIVLIYLFAAAAMIGNIVQHSQHAHQVALANAAQVLKV